MLVGSINRKYSLFQRFTMILTFYFYTDRFQLSNWFLSAGSNSHLNYGQRGIKLELDEKGLHITVFNCFVFKTNVVKPIPIRKTLASLHLREMSTKDKGRRNNPNKTLH